TWSLGIEEKFYLLWPVVAFVVWRCARMKRLVGTALLTLGWIAVGYAIDLIGPHYSGFNWAAMSACIKPYHRILLGCLVALLLHDPVWFGRVRWLASSSVMWLSVAAFAVLRAVQTRFADSHELLNRLDDTYSLIFVLAF